MTTLTQWHFEDQDAAYNSYFYHIYHNLYEAACSGGNPISAITLEQIFNIVGELRDGDISLEDLIQKMTALMNPQNSRLEIERAVKFAAGLLVPLHFSGAGGVRRGEAIDWPLNKTLTHSVAERFSTARVSSNSIFPSHGINSICTVCNSMTSFPKNFNAKQIERITGFEIVWTSNLADHLLLLDMDEKIKLHIFHHVKVLQHHLELEK
jgi:hypothetical protein